MYDVCRDHPGLAWAVPAPTAEVGSEKRWHSVEWPVLSSINARLNRAAVERHPEQWSEYGLNVVFAEASVSQLTHVPDWDVVRQTTARLLYAGECILALGGYGGPGWATHLNGVRIYQHRSVLRYWQKQKAEAERQIHAQQTGVILSLTRDAEGDYLMLPVGRSPLVSQ